MRIDLAPDAVARCIQEVGFGFMFAPAHHGATRFVIPVRKELAVRTIFNFLGPLTNPAGATRQVIGVPTRRSSTSWRARSRGSAPTARARRLQRRRARRALHVAPTRVVQVDDGEVRCYEVSPRTSACRAPSTRTRRRPAAANAATALSILGGDEGSGA